MKYFEINADEETLATVERVGESISRLSEALENLAARERDITKAINPPWFILKHYAKEFFRQVGVELSPVSVPYAEYAFEYVSAGGNSSQRTTIRLDLQTVDALVEALARKIKLKKSAAGQRALMTAKFRQFIKDRDGHACKQCGVSVADEPNLLLEVDHIIPVSRGGLSTEGNLQTLCWRCNRTKSNKVLDGGYDIPMNTQGATDETSFSDPRPTQCPACGERVDPQWHFCSHCRFHLAAVEWSGGDCEMPDQIRVRGIPLDASGRHGWA